MNGKVVLKSATLIVIVCLVISGVVFLFEIPLLNNTESFKKNSNTFNFKRVQYRFRIWNTQNQPLVKVHFYVHGPLELTGTQRCMGIESSYPYELISDTLGNQVLKYTFETFPPYASKIVSIRADLILAATPIESAKAIFVESVTSIAEDVNIRQLADQLKSKTVRATAQNIYRWVAENISYTGYLKKAKGARQVLMDRTGDCTEFADLFVALAHAAKIPARRISGYLSYENKVLRPSDFHDWAEFYEDGVWRIADSQKKNFDANYPDYIAMKIYNSSTKHRPMEGYDPMGGFHRFNVDKNGLKVKMES
jgi:hypothetical protein